MAVPGSSSRVTHSGATGGWMCVVEGQPAGARPAYSRPLETPTVDWGVSVSRLGPPINLFSSLAIATIWRFITCSNLVEATWRSSIVMSLWRPSLQQAISRRELCGSKLNLEPTVLR